MGLEIRLRLGSVWKLRLGLGFRLGLKLVLVMHVEVRVVNNVCGYVRRWIRV